MVPRELTAYWGKAGEGEDCHPLIHHSLDVAAVAAGLLNRHIALRDGLAASLGVPADVLSSWVKVFAALHDLGKFSHRFQNLRRDLASVRLSSQLPDKDYNIRHDQLGYLLWCERVKPALRQSGVFASADWSDRQVERWLDQWAAVATGHHGQPPRASSHALLEDHFRAKDVDAALAFSHQACDLLLKAPAALPDGLPVREAGAAVKRASWWLSGLMILADWLGSNRDYFPFHDQAESLPDYWQRAQRQADAALDASGVLPCEVAAGASFAELFPKLADYPPSPLQQLAAELPLASGPQLLICEDVTGAGKTEAALLLAQRLMSECGAQGLYFALPTMATANAMFGRASDMYQRLFAADARPSVVLAHGGRELDERFQQMILPPVRYEENSQLPRAEADDVASARCSAWLADGRKRALLAQVGVGTIDQALQAVLPNRHQSLRLLGLFGKVLLVDEIHANDRYMHKLLCTLLTAHARSGGSAILLSATLTAKMRRELLDAYGAGEEGAQCGEYPLLSHASPQQPTQSIPVGTPARVARKVAVEYHAEMTPLLAELARVIGDGRCACWVRNSVADAREAWQLLREQLPQAEISLFHARCALGDRLAAENGALATFGRDAEPNQRRGRVLIATQVVEQSLDLDFDLMISDLAPIDLLIQRAGRLCRHPRDAAGRLKTEGADERGTPRLLVHGPLPQADAGRDWLRASLRNTAAVYPDHAALWLTARELCQRGGWRMPEDARALIETVFAEDDDEGVPEALAAIRREVMGQRGAEGSQAQLNAIALDAGYRIDGPDWWADSKTPTRLGEESISVYLARRENGQLRPWYASERHAWALSRIQLPCKRLAGGTQGEEVEALKLQLPGKGRWCDVLVLEPTGDELWMGEARDAQEQSVQLRYTAAQGLIYPHELQQE